VLFIIHHVVDGGVNCCIVGVIVGCHLSNVVLVCCIIGVVVGHHIASATCYASSTHLNHCPFIFVVVHLCC
jgi:hypothetical protein